MTPEGLRERVARAAHQAECGCTDEPDDMHRSIADAIINELGLTVEMAFRFDGKDKRYPIRKTGDLATIGLYGRPAEARFDARVVGRWEENDTEEVTTRE